MPLPDPLRWPRTPVRIADHPNHFFPYQAWARARRSVAALPVAARSGCEEGAKRTVMERDIERLVDEAGQSLGVPWTPEERAEAVGEAAALARLLDLLWAYPLPDPVDGLRPAPR
jgi:hypothetical protein